MLFCAKPGYKIIGGDFSAQEPRLTSFYAQDPAMLGAYAEGKDLYAVIASMSFDKPYEDCLEFYPEGTVIQYEGKTVTCGHKTHQNKDGKGRRTQAKSILLGLLYGRGAKSVGEQINKTTEEAQEIINKFFKSFPSVKKWIDETHENAYKLGYVEDVAGRRRRLPDLLLPKYTFEEINKSVSFNPLLGTVGTGTDDEVKIKKYQDLLSKCKWRDDVDKVKKLAEQDNLHIHDNSGFIAQAERQSVNSRVQGGAATLTKQALIDLYNNERLRELDCHLINTVHDEILMECPSEVADECAELLCDVMKSSAKKYVPQPAMSVDAYIVNCWYLDEFQALVESEFKKMLDKMPDLEAFEEMCKSRSESSRSQIYEIVGPLMKNKPADAERLQQAIDNGDIVD